MDQASFSKSGTNEKNIRNVIFIISSYPKNIPLLTVFLKAGTDCARFSQGIYRIDRKDKKGAQAP